jgi:hypothetical protein
LGADLCALGRVLGQKVGQGFLSSSGLGLGLVELSLQSLSVLQCLIVALEAKVATRTNEREQEHQQGHVSVEEPMQTVV